MELAENIYLIIAVYIPLIPLLIYLFRVKKYNVPYIYVFLLISSEASINIYSHLQAQARINNMPSIHLLVFLETLFAGLFFSNKLKITFLKNLTLIITVSFLIYTTVNSLIINNITSTIPIPIGIQGYILALFALFLFYDILKRDEIIILKNSLEFWIAVAILFYFGTTQTFFLFQDYVEEYSYAYNKLFLRIHYSISSIYYIILSIGLWKKN